METHKPDKNIEMYRYIIYQYVSDDTRMEMMDLKTQTSLSYKTTNSDGEMIRVTHAVAIRIIVPKKMKLFHNLVFDPNYNNMKIKDFHYEIIACFNNKWKVIDDRLSNGRTLYDITQDLENERGFHITPEFGFLTNDELSEYNKRKIEKFEKRYEENKKRLDDAFKSVYIKDTCVEELYRQYILGILGMDVSCYMDYWIMDHRLLIIGNFVTNYVNAENITDYEKRHQLEMELFPLTKQIIDDSIIKK